MVRVVSTVGWVATVVGSASSSAPQATATNTIASATMVVESHAGFGVLTIIPSLHGRSRRRLEDWRSRFRPPLFTVGREEPQSGPRIAEEEPREDRAAHPGEPVHLGGALHDAHRERQSRFP